MNQLPQQCLQDTYYRLREWGLWRHGLLSDKINFSSRSILHEIAESGGVVVRTTAMSNLPDNDAAEEVDQLVNIFARQSANKAHVLSMHYVVRDDVQNKIVWLGLSKRTYYRYLQSAECWVSQQLGKS